MSANNINHTTVNNLCISCGLCGGVCPKSCIEFTPSKGMFLPIIEEAICINCGMCLKVCPGKGFDYTNHPLKNSSSSFWFGDYQDICAAHTNNSSRRASAVSGGIVTELVEQLLARDYAAAFLVSGHSYGKDQVKAEKFTSGDSLEACTKSRYLCVSQENTIKYILSHREEKLVLVGVSCFVEGIINAIDTFGLNRDNYFIIGLFCDKTMTQNVVEFFNQKKYIGAGTMKYLYFRSKEVLGWPGGVRIVTDDGLPHDYKNTERMQVKEYFQPERCLYCLDKLNRYADISVGDDYREQNSDKLGSNTVILRTDKAVSLWSELGKQIESQPMTEQQVSKSQKLSKRRRNLSFSRIKEKKTGSVINSVNEEAAKISFRDRLTYRIRIRKIAVGSRFENNPGLLRFCLIEQKAKALIKRILKGA